ncbi:IS110 family transposase [Sulfitobacter pseudonitzschiae]|uniref:IS110 family transposase n=1 Tax=Pseudosulfitobacter pseudonitzschiae TaxID=1402135 RepID=UPI001AFCA16D|nr:IS110 family transposase [Pseudosulfitobacter pseudonitzschiae]MBM1818080.1 IS110 family transposase [Pseudosulfitobacter pseudonitzschiae]MBM1835160.1 IS110 family transposase [Pseudosulfitobacter pseudonitzschiae]MBM1839963.1 IS110 family transposase [Pseudosulfitobacter pseudonitzschiae]MBM1844825.1 IS110 family transposase [Pseudosulfitobacter pseudonitzschiae]MBM1849625.1 IS110 family transposase [Pseudosulfitobacter pseudonitzschiae]
MSDVIVTVGLDLAKNVFQVHGVDANGRACLRRKLRRAEITPFFASLSPCLVGMEACASSHFWAREIARLGHEVRLMPPAYVKPYVKRGKTDASDAEAICEAVTRPTMRFVAMKSEDQQAVLMLHKTRELLVRQRTMQTNALRAHLAELGIVAAQGVEGLSSLKTYFHKVMGALPEHATAALQSLIRMADCLVDEIEGLESRILDWHRANDASRRLATIPGIGPITASAIAANVPDASLFRTARQFAAWLGLTPRANSSGGKDRQMGISKQGDGYIRRLLVSGASAVMRFARQGDPGKAWLVGLKERKRPKVAAVAQANKTARIAWAILRRNEVFAARTA